MDGQTQRDEGDRTENSALSVASSPIQKMQRRQIEFAAKTNRHFMALHEANRRMRKTLEEMKQEPSKERLKQMTLQLQVKVAEAKSKAAEASVKRSETSTAKCKAAEASAEAAKVESQKKILQLRNQHLDKSPEERDAAEKLAKDQLSTDSPARHKTMEAARVATVTGRQKIGTDRTARRAQGCSATPQPAEADFFDTTGWYGIVMVGQRNGSPGSKGSKGSQGSQGNLGSQGRQGNE